MTVTLDQANIYTGAGTAQTNHTGTTTAGVAAGALIVILMHRFRNTGGGAYTATGGGLTWATLADPISVGNILIQMFGAFAPAGLASGTTGVGVNGSVGGNDYTVGIASYLGVDDSGGVAGAIRADGGSNAGTAAWGSGTIAGNSGDAYIGGAGGDGTLRTSTPDAGNTERIDFNSAISSGSITLVDKLTGNANDSLDGDWSGTLTHVSIGVALIPAGGGGTPDVVRRELIVPNAAVVRSSYY